MSKPDIKGTGGEARFVSAVDNATTAIMMVDLDLNVVYANTATTVLMREHADTLESLFPKFNARELVGTNIDVFHKDPSHQRRLLANPANLPHAADIQVGPLTFRINVTAAYDEAGAHIGSNLEWSDVTTLRRSTRDSARLTSMMEGLETKLMMADPEGNIIYANPSVLAMLRTREREIQKVLPHFRVDDVVGSNFDIFHKNPAVQQGYLKDPSRLPHKVEIEVGILTMGLNAQAVRGPDGEFLGMSVEWTDLTETANAMDQINGLISDAMEGVLDNRIDTGVLTGNIETIGNGINGLLDAVTEPLAQVKSVADGLASGDLDVSMDGVFQGEFLELQDALNKSVELLRKNTRDSARLTSMIEGLDTQLMMADPKGNIIYANPSVMKMLRYREREIQKVLPHFNVDKVVGSNFDIFHKNPAHQQGFLKDPSRLPHKVEIGVGTLTMGLNAVAVQGTDGEFLGMAVEWSDLTEEADAMRQIDGLMADAMDGVLENRIDTSTLTGNIETIGNGINGLLESVVLPLQEAKSVANGLAEGNFDVQMHGAFRGEFKELQDALNTSVTLLRKNTAESARLTSMVEGLETQLMMADTEGNIIYANPSVLAMLRHREREIQRVLPHFRVDEVVGSNFDIFHKNPAKQQGILANPDRLPHKVEIKVGTLTMGLNALAVRGPGGEHLGMAVEWSDITEEADAMNQIEGLITDAVDGRLERRIDTSSMSGHIEIIGNGINNVLDAVVAPVRAAKDVAELIANGDLSQPMHGDFEGEFEELQNALNTSIENLRRMVGEVSESTGSIASASSEIARGNTDLSQRTEEQASSLEETASSMEELTSTVRQNAENASQANVMAGKAREEAEKGGSVVDEAISAMAEINDSSKQIADIIGVIDEIAFQTNLLALNAAVEAARAGEQGRGFAVVATEVRNLAQRSASAAKEIKALIKDSVEKVEQGSALVDESGRTLSGIVAGVKKVSDIVADIAAASNEQAQGIEQVNKAIVQMDEVTQQNAALVEEAAAAAESLDDQARGMQEMISFFSLGDAKPAPARSGKQAMLGGSNAIKVPSRRGSGQDSAGTQRPAAVAIPAPSVSEGDEWMEF